MTIKIPQNRAIQLLEERLLDLSKHQTDLKALKNRLQSDIEAIFGKGSSQSLAVLTLDTNHISVPDNSAKLKKTFTQTIEGFIRSIKDFHIINQEKNDISEQEYKEKYSNLLKNWNDLIPEYNDLLKNYEIVVRQYNDALSENRILEDKIHQKRAFFEKIRILFLGASPVNEVRLRIDEELRDIEKGLKLATLRDQFELKSEWAVTTKTLQQALLDETPNILHFSGHGDINGIAVEDSLGNSKLVDNNALGSLFELFSGSIKCVVLNSCYSESQAREISKYIPYVIGMKSSVNDTSAITFSVGFYTALGAGRDIEFAYKMGTVAIKLEGIQGSDLPILIG